MPQSQPNWGSKQTTKTQNLSRENLKTLNEIVVSVIDHQKITKYKLWFENIPDYVKSRKK